MKRNRKDILKCALAGFGAGIANGLFGSGGGMILVPVFASMHKDEEKKAFATSVFCVLFLSIYSIILYSRTQSIGISELLPYLLGGAAGGAVGGILFKRLSVTVVRRIFALFILWAALRAIFM